MSSGVQTGGVHHIRMTVSDPARSRDFYTSLLGFSVMMDFPDGVLLTNGSLFIGLRTAAEPSQAPANDTFNPSRIGLDHLSFSVETRDDLETAARLCKERGISCGEIVDFGEQFRFYVLMLHDPDGIQIELSANYPKA